jgi:hypothetical protein
MAHTDLTNPTTYQGALTMARIVEDSDDEFPDLVDLLKRSKVAICRKTSAATSTKAVVGKEGDESVESDLEENHDMAKDVEKDEVKSKDGKGIGLEKPKSKKHVLKQTSDNPLLRPIARTHINAASSDLLSNPEGWRMKVRAKKEDRRVIEKTSSIPLSMKFGLDEKELDGVKAAKRRAIRNAAEKDHPKAERKVQPIEEEFDTESDGLSDFIVNDSTFLEEDDSEVETPPPRSARRLVKGRRQVRDLSPAEGELDLRMGQLTVEDGPGPDPNKSVQKANDPLSRDITSSKASRNTESKTSKSKNEVPETDKKQAEPNSDIEDPFILRL